MKFAPKAFRDTRIKTTKQVEEALEWTENLTNIRPETLMGHPSILPMLPMTTCPPIAHDRLVGLSGASSNLVKNMETKNRIPPRMPHSDVNDNLEKIGAIIEKMADPDIFLWKERGDQGTTDRLCSAIAGPIIRNAQNVSLLH